MLYSDIEREVKAHFTGVDTTTARFCIQETLDILCDQFPLAISSCSLALTANDGEYALTSGSPFFQFNSASVTSSLPLARILSAKYLKSSTDIRTLTHTTKGQLETAYPDWIYEASSEPFAFFVAPSSTGSNNLGLYPKPLTATDPANGTGYPRVDIEYTNRITATYGGSDALPAVISYPYAVVYGAVMRVAARETDSGIEAKFKAMYEREVAGLADALQKSRGQLPKMRAGIRGIQ